MHRRFGGRLLLALCGAAVTAGAAEAGLRLWFRGDVDRLLASRRRDAAPDAKCVLCVGDSYTFGLYYRPEEAYPGRLEQILRAGEPAHDGGAARWFVDNAGIPAQNLAQVIARLPEQLARLRPVAVVVLAGFNDRWNFAAPGRARGAEGAAGGGGLGGLVVVKLVRLAFANRAAPLDGKTRFERFSVEGIELAGEDGGAAIDIEKTGGRLDDAGHFAAVKERLLALVSQVEAAGALAVLCSYPSPERHYDAPSRAARAVAQERGLPFVDLRGAFARELERHRYEELLIPGDRHPTDRGYWRMAVLVAQALAERGVFAPGEPLAGELAAAPANGWAIGGLPEQVHAVTLRAADGAAARGSGGAGGAEDGGPGGRFELAGPPRAHWKIVLSGATSPPQRYGYLELALAADATFERSANDDRCEGVFDDTGRASFVVPADYLPAARHLALVVLHDLLVGAQDLQVRALTAPLPLD